MKNFILGLVVGAALVFLGTYVGKTYAQTITFDTNLSYGSTGSEVSALQEFLVEQGVLNPQYVTGNFYSVTLAAVKEFQTKESISPVSGFVGPITRSTINTLLEQEVPVSEGNAATTTEPIDLSQVTPIVTAPIVLSQVQIAPAVQTLSCPSIPTVTVVPEKGTINGDVITFPKQDGYEYFDVSLTDSCVDYTQLNFTYNSPVQSFSNWTNSSANNSAFGVISTSTPQSVTITAAEPNGETVTRTLTIQEQ